MIKEIQLTQAGLEKLKQELKELINEWAKKYVNMRFWKIINTQELKITAEDLE